MKKVISFALCFLMALSLCIPALADDAPKSETFENVASKTVETKHFRLTSSDADPDGWYAGLKYPFTIKALVSGIMITRIDCTVSWNGRNYGSIEFDHGTKEPDCAVETGVPVSVTNIDAASVSVIDGDMVEFRDITVYYEETDSEHSSIASETVYCLCGYINGSDYGTTEQSNPKWNAPGEYVFSNDGKLTVTFAADSYVQVKDSYDWTFYAFERYVVDGTPTRLFERNETYNEKMFVPGGTTVTFTLTKDENGALVLGYEIFAEEYTVSFDMMNHGEQVSSQTVNEGEKVQKPTDPTADGYTFDGWYKDAALKTPWNFANDTVTANTTLYAKWTPVPTAFTVIFNTMDHGEQVSSQTVNEGEKVQKPTDPTADGYTFDGWYKDQNCTEEWNFATDTVNGNITLYAKWIRTLEFDFSPYCLCGYINGSDYGTTEQSNPKWNAPGEYVFSNDGKLTVTFAADSYVQVKDSYDWTFYAFERYVKDGTPTRLFEANDTYKEKMLVPGGTTVTFTLTKDENGAFVLGYDTTTATGSVLSNGNLWIIIAVAVVAIGGVAALVIDKKKKKPALASGENTDEE